ncbi:hypothetical protein JKG47_01745 [Acidithiobacillus sp. MC6.1]|nr:hypothetical protein [Acidithiobacillus sp. MC6.1]
MSGSAIEVAMFFLLAVVLMPLSFLVIGFLLVFLPVPPHEWQQFVVLLLRFVGIILVFRGLVMLESLPRLFRIWTPRAQPIRRQTRSECRILQARRTYPHTSEMTPILSAATDYFHQVYSRDTSLPTSGTLNIIAAYAFALLVMGYGMSALTFAFLDHHALHLLLSAPCFLGVLAASAILLILERRSSVWMRRAYSDTDLSKLQALKKASDSIGLTPESLYQKARGHCASGFDRPWQAAFGVRTPFRIYWLFLLEPVFRFGLPMAISTPSWIMALILAAVSIVGSVLFIAMRYLLYRHYDPENYPYPCWYFPLRMMCSDIRTEMDL